MQKYSSNFKTPTTFLEAIQHWARKIFASHVHRACINTYYSALSIYEDPKNQNNDELLDQQYSIMLDMKDIIAACKKIFPTAAPRKPDKKVVGYFPIRPVITDWCYLNHFDRSTADIILREHKWPEYIRVDFYLKKTENDGAWYTEEKRMELFSNVDFETVEAFEENVHFLEDTVRHEVQHMGQDLLQHLKLLKRPAGLPPFKARNTSTYVKEDTKNNPPPPLFDPDHLLEDEFYPRLRDAIMEFKRFLPLEKDKKAFFQFWIGLNPDYESDNPSLILSPNPFFAALKAYDMPKYRKAISELWKSFQLFN